ncbi:MAG: hypothetical protein KIT24_01825 [Phycisphaeraceae bacterium]|nr:hypothetical protein [Phycisphaeraceae bacterium]
MTRRVVLMWMILAVLLVGAAAVVLSPRFSGGHRGGGTLLAFSPSSVHELIITGPDWHRAYHFRRVDGRWHLRMPPAGSPPESATAWPVDSQRVDAVLMILRDRLEAVGAAAPPDAAVQVVLRAGNGEHHVRFEAAGPGAKVRVWGTGPEATVRQGLADREVRELFEERSLQTWRTALVLPDAVSGGSRLMLQSGSQQVRLGQVRGRWAVLEPALGPADSAFVAATLRAVASLPVAAFEDSIVPDAPELGLDRPAARIRLERDVRTLEGEGAAMSTVVSELVLGPLADVGGTHSLGVARAWVERSSAAPDPLWGPVVVRVPADYLRPLKADPLAYVSRRAIGVQAADVQTIVLRRIGTEDGAAVRFQRTSAGWESQDERVLLEDEQHLMRLITLLTESTAGAILKDVLAGIEPLASVEVHAIGLGSPRPIRVGLLEAGGVILAPSLVVDDGSGVFRLYERAPLESLVVWISRGT